MKGARPNPSNAPDARRHDRSGVVLFYDAFTRIGPRGHKHPADPWSLEELLAEMDHCSISGALVTCTTCASYDPMTANLRLSARLRDHPHLAAAWNVLPPGGDEFPAPRELLQLMRRNGVEAVILHPLTNGWDLLAPQHSPLFRALIRARIPVFLPRQELESFRALDNFLGANPGLALILTGAGWAEQRFVLPLLKRHPGLHLTFDRFQIHYGLEDLVADGFADRLLFGSNAPEMSAGAHRAYVDLAAIPPPAKRKIAGANILHLLGRKPPPRRENPNEDCLMAAVRRGDPLPVPFIDMHMHILDEGLNGGGGAYRMSRGGPSGVFPLLQRMGCAGGGFMSWNGTVGCDAVAGNRCVQAALDVAPPGYWGLATLDPTHYSAAQMQSQMRAIYSDQRFIGMKPYVSYGVEYHHRSYSPWWQFGNRLGLYAGLHRVRNDFQEVDALAKRYPRVRWVVFHCGASYKVADQAIECVLRHPNVYAEITLTPVPGGMIDYLVEHAGADRVLYGSDLPMRDPRQHLGWVVFSRIALEKKIKVLFQNALNIIKPCLNRLPAACRPVISDHPTTNAPDVRRPA